METPFRQCPLGVRQSLKQASGLSDRDLNAAIGWLAREDKIDFDIDEQHDRLFLHANVYIELTQNTIREKALVVFWFYVRQCGSPSHQETHEASSRAILPHSLFSL